MTSFVIAQSMLVGCGGGGGDKTNITPSSNAVNLSSSVAVMSSSRMPTSAALMSSSSAQSLIQSSSQSSNKSSNQSSSEAPALVDASNQFTSVVNERFYVYQDPSQPGVLHYLPKYLALTGMPGVASVQRTDKVSDLLNLFLDLSDTDWTSANQVTFSSRYTLAVDLQGLRQESEAAGYKELVDIEVMPPLISFEQRYTTAVPKERVQIQCKNLTLLVNNEEVSLHDCNLVDTGGLVATHTVNNIGSFKYEQLSFDPATISENSALRGTLNVEYTLPGSQEFDRLLAGDNGNLQPTWQLYFNWPQAHANVSSSTVTINWKLLLADFKARVSAGATQWSDGDISTFVTSEISAGAIGLPTAAELAPTLKSGITSYIKQELFVAIYLEAGNSPLLWAPKLRFKNVDQPDTQQIALRYFESDLSLVSRMDLSCLSKPDGQNNIYKSSSCSGNSLP
ncbi:MAG TPA: hypothetical protein VLC79_04535 [Cellvibrio sp.]|nr:hypothetical protein [Cellvibrio sp.]